MSMRAMIWALDQTVGVATRKLVLVKLADNVDEDRAECWPSIRSIARVCECDVRSVRRHLRQLETDGFIETTVGGWKGGQNYVSRYRLVGYLRHRHGDSRPGMEPIPAGGTSRPHPEKGEDTMSNTGGHDVQHGGAQSHERGDTMSSKSVIEPTIESVSESVISCEEATTTVSTPTIAEAKVGESVTLTIGEAPAHPAHYLEHLRTAHGYGPRVSPLDQRALQQAQAWHADGVTVSEVDYAVEVARTALLADGDDRDPPVKYLASCIASARRGAPPVAAGARGDGGRATGVSRPKQLNYGARLAAMFSQSPDDSATVSTQAQRPALGSGS